MNNSVTLIPFKPHLLAANGHLQTFVGYYLPGPQFLSHTRWHKVPVSEGGVTHKQDRPAAVQKLLELIANGIYPENLWE